MKLTHNQFPANVAVGDLVQNTEEAFTILYESDNGAIIVPHNFEAMKYLSEETSWIDIGEFDDLPPQQKFDSIISKRPIIIYVINDGNKSHKFAYGFGNVTEFEDKNAYSFSYQDKKANGVNALYDEAIGNADTDIIPYLKACAHCHDVERYNNDFQRNIIIDNNDAGNESVTKKQSNLIVQSGNLTNIARTVICGIMAKEYMPCDMFGANVIDPSDHESKLHSFGHPDLQTNIDFLLEADRLFDYGSKPLQYINPDYMTEGEYCNIALMLIAQNAHNIKNVEQIAFENLDFVSGLLELASSDQPANQQQILRHVHRIPALYGHISGNFQTMKQNLTKNQGLAFSHIGELSN